MSAIHASYAAYALSLLVVAACSSGTPEPRTEAAAAPPTEQAAEPSPAPQAAPATVKAAEPEAKPDTAEAEPEQPPEPKSILASDEPPRPPSEILTTEDVSFELDLNGSALKEILETKCESRVGDDPAAMSQCVEKERSKFPADVLSFRRQMGGQLRWTVFKRNRNTLQVVYSVPFTFEDETESTISMRLQGKGTGYQPLLVPRKTIPLRIPDRYSVEVDDPQWGILLYKSKVGLASN